MRDLIMVSLSGLVVSGHHSEMDPFHVYKKNANVASIQ